MLPLKLLPTLLVFMFSLGAYAKETPTHSSVITKGDKPPSSSQANKVMGVRLHKNTDHHPNLNYVGHDTPSSKGIARIRNFGEVELMVNNSPLEFFYRNKHYTKYKALKVSSPLLLSSKANEDLLWNGCENNEQWVKKRTCLLTSDIELMVVAKALPVHYDSVNIKDALPISNSTEDTTIHVTPQNSHEKSTPKIIEFKQFPNPTLIIGSIYKKEGVKLPWSSKGVEFTHLNPFQREHKILIYNESTEIAMEGPTVTSEELKKGINISWFPSQKVTVGFLNYATNLSEYSAGGFSSVKSLGYGTLTANDESETVLLDSKHGSVQNYMAFKSNEEIVLSITHPGNTNPDVVWAKCPKPKGKTCIVPPHTTADMSVLINNTDSFLCFHSIQKRKPRSVRICT